MFSMLSELVRCFEQGDNPVNAVTLVSGELDDPQCSQKAVTSASNVSFDVLRIHARRQIESFEHWSRRLLDDIFRYHYGDSYIDAMLSEDTPLVKNEIKKSIASRMEKEPTRYPRPIDAIMLENIQYFFTREDLYKAHFKGVFIGFFSGTDEIRRLLDRIIAIRNGLSHDNAISVREAEQVLCYTNDFIDAYKAYYQKQGKGRNFNVPVILSVSDSQGNRSFRMDTQHLWEIRNYSLKEMELFRAIRPDAITTTHRSGDYYRIELEVDNSFSNSDYEIEWLVKANYDQILNGHGNTIEIQFTDPMVSLTPKIEVKLVTKKGWHRFAHIGCDDFVRIHLSQVLPPIEDAY